MERADLKLDGELRENVAHGQPDFRAAHYPVGFSRGNQQVLPVHWHSELEIIHMTRGDAEFRIDEDIFQASAGSTLFIPSESLHSGISNSLHGGLYHSVVFHPCLLFSTLSDRCQSQYINLLDRSHFHRGICINAGSEYAFQVKTNVEAIIRSFCERHCGFELAVKGRLLTLLSLMFEHGEFGELQAINNADATIQANVRAAIGFLENNYDQKIYVQELADTAHLSRTHFTRQFKRYTGMTPIEYLNMYRVQQAMHFIRAQGVSVKEAASLVGFDNFSYFSKVFRHYQGVNPSDVKD